MLAGLDFTVLNYVGLIFPANLNSQYGISVFDQRENDLALPSSYTPLFIWKFGKR
jgi:hypothetical protein